MSNDHKERYEYGIRAEAIACDFLRSASFVIIDQRYKTPHGEIDIIAQDGEVLVFVEVKARKRLRQGDLITQRQIERNCAAGNFFLSKNPDYTDFDMRFDFIAVVGNKVHEHIKNAWDYQ